MSSVLAEVTRGGVVESEHHGVVVVSNVAGEIVASAGDPERVVFYRSSAKPFQAIPLIESGAADHFGFTPRELALSCASHSGQPHHRAEVTGMLAKIGLTPDALQCGAIAPYNKLAGARVIAGLDPLSPLNCDCSGKHAGMLATCVLEALPLESYLDPTHPLQQRILGVMSDVLRVPESGILPGTDGCSLPTFGAPISAFARSWATLADPGNAPAEQGGAHAAALHRLRAAMMEAPENVAGEGELVTELMLLGNGRICAKSGAEGLFCLALPEQGLGIAIRVLDGSFRVHAVIVASVLQQLGVWDEAAAAALFARANPELHNHNGWHVGDLRAAFTLSA